MRVAVTGGNGFLGKYLVEQLQEMGHQVKILSRNSSNNSVKTDYSLESLSEVLKNQDAVVHLAAKRGAQGKKIEFQDNEVLTQNLYDAAHSNGIKNIVYSSTISVYSGENDLPWSELTLPQPGLMYGISKLTCEMIGNLYNQKYGMAIKNMRLAHLYGPGEKNNYMINLFFRQAYNKQELKLNTQSTAKREFLYVKDAARAIIKALENENLAGTFNIGSGDALTNQEVAEKINTIFCNQNKLDIINPNGEDNSVSSYMDNSMSERKLDFKAVYSFEEALNEIFSELKEQSNVPIYY